MAIILTKQAQSRSVLRGIDINEINYIISKGIKIRKQNNIISTLNNNVVVYTKQGSNIIVKMVMTK